MTLLEYVKNEFKHGPELFRDQIIQTNDKGVSITRNTERLRKMSLGIVSCNNAEEWYNLVRQVCVPGTIIEPYNEEWNKLYEDYTLLVRNSLTLQLLQERRERSAKTLLDILARRDKSHWSEDKKSLEVSTGNETKTITFKFEGI